MAERTYEVVEGAKVADMKVGWRLVGEDYCTRTVTDTRPFAAKCSHGCVVDLAICERHHQKYGLSIERPMPTPPLLRSRLEGKGANVCWIVSEGNLLEGYGICGIYDSLEKAEDQAHVFIPKDAGWKEKAVGKTSVAWSKEESGSWSWVAITKLQINHYFLRFLLGKEDDVPTELVTSFARGEAKR